MIFLILELFQIILLHFYISHFILVMLFFFLLFSAKLKDLDNPVDDSGSKIILKSIVYSSNACSDVLIISMQVIRNLKIKISNTTA